MVKTPKKVKKRKRKKMGRTPEGGETRLNLGGYEPSGMRKKRKAKKRAKKKRKKKRKSETEQLNIRMSRELFRLIERDAAANCRKNPGQARMILREYYEDELEE